MMIHDITEQVGKHKARKRVGRGHGSGMGKTSGRGHKGAGSRSGYKRRAYFEGGQMPFLRRIPKRGFSNENFRTLYHIVNVKQLEARFEAGDEVTAEALAKMGIIRDTKLPLKVLGEGDFASASLAAQARKLIRAAGDPQGLKHVRDLYLRSRRVAIGLAKAGGINFQPVLRSGMCDLPKARPSQQNPRFHL